LCASWPQDAPGGAEVLEDVVEAREERVVAHLFAGQARLAAASRERAEKSMRIVLQMRMIAI